MHAPAHTHTRQTHTPVCPGPSLTDKASARCLPLPEGGAVVRVQLLEHAVVAQVLLSATSAEGFHKLLLWPEERGVSVCVCVCVCVFLCGWILKRSWNSPSEETEGESLTDIIQHGYCVSCLVFWNPMRLSQGTPSPNPPLVFAIVCVLSEYYWVLASLFISIQ